MVFYCSECGQAVLRLYNSEDGSKKNLCASCKAKIDKLASDKPIDKLCAKIDILNERIDKMATAFKYNDARCSEIEKKHGDIVKRIESTDKKIGELGDWIAEIEDRVPTKKEVKNARL